MSDLSGTVDAPEEDEDHADARPRAPQAPPGSPAPARSRLVLPGAARSRHELP
ncbi:hypothetical protein [Streptomyces sp. XY006]|uniref:hypothetical protein n=1 Tax=Streptomyces sp. XY006 TaxID=2021410 RepID=UPI0015C5C454|nr:hypothetical protein [Streptomyces sp. XY006]